MFLCVNDLIRRTFGKRMQTWWLRSCWAVCLQLLSWPSTKTMPLDFTSTHDRSLSSHRRAFIRFIRRRGKSPWSNAEFKQAVASYFPLSLSVSDLIKTKLLSPLSQPFPEHHADTSDVCSFGSVLVYLQLSDAVSFKNEIFYNTWLSYNHSNTSAIFFIISPKSG